MARYKVHSYAKRTRTLTESEPFLHLGQARQYAEGRKTQSKVVTILKECEDGHPANVGKYFLHLIVK